MEHWLFLLRYKLLQYYFTIFSCSIDHLHVMHNIQSIQATQKKKKKKKKPLKFILKGVLLLSECVNKLSIQATIVVLGTAQRGRAPSMWRVNMTLYFMAFVSSANLKRKKWISAIDRIFICRYAKSFPRQIRGPACKSFKQKNNNKTRSVIKNSQPSPLSFIPQYIGDTSLGYRHEMRQI